MKTAYNSIPAGARVFDERAEEYDSWFENSLLFDIELAALEKVRPDMPAPSLELGIGPGRFARALGVDFGLDPALSPLHIAKRRDIMVVNGMGDAMPIASRTVGSIWLLFTLCFLEEPLQVLRECHRVLTSAGRLALGFVPAGSSWGQSLDQKAKSDHVYYRHARFYSLAEAKEMLEQSKFQIVTSWTTLQQGPDALSAFEAPRSGYDASAGFCVLVARKKEDLR
jgi:ubiquinone/menaquinone biosynthesis C-methylase UbiE